MKDGDLVNTLVREKLAWSPRTALEDGMEKTYRWIYDQITSGKPKDWERFTFG